MRNTSGKSWQVSVKIDTYEQLAELPIGAIIRDSQGEVGVKRERSVFNRHDEWQALGHDRDYDGYLDLTQVGFFTLPVDLLWPR